MKRFRLIVILFGVLAVLSLLTLVLFEPIKWRIVSWYLGLPRPEYSVTVENNVMIPMRDGVRLAADIYRPDDPGRFPVVVARTPYGKTNPEHKYGFAGKLFAGQGYIFVVQDVRGKFDSEGDYYPYMTEDRDGHDTFEWAGQQEWSTGSVGTYGFSYWGSTQWLPAPLGSEYLKAMIPIVTGQNLYKRWIYDGIFRYNDVLFWHYGNTCKTSRSLKGINMERAIRHLPLIDADDELGVDLPAYNHWISNPVPGRYWDQIRVDDKVDKIQAPALIIDGWYDYYLDLALSDFIRMRTAGASEEARRSQIIIGPWTHTAVSKFDDVDFGAEANFMKQVKNMTRWYDYWLKGIENGVTDEGPVRLFVMGKNEWRTEEKWPLARARYTEYYLHSGGNANSRTGDGGLDTSAPEDEPPDTFTYDPDNPVPSVGGTSIYGAAVAGPRDQREVETRPDVLVYTTPPLKEDIEATGPVSLVLYASSSAKDTDFMGKLVDVYPDGKAINIQAGMIRARFRKSLSEPSFLEEGRIYKFYITVGSTSIVFKKGHRIRLEVSSSYFPEFGRNLNTGADIGMTAHILKADQTIYHDRGRPSYLLLPIIPQEE